MTPKEKAEYLVELYQRQGSVTMERYVAKQCVLIAVELALEFVDGNSLDDAFDKTLYLIEVKNEIFEL